MKLGLSVLLLACKAIMRVAARYYNVHKDAYTPQVQAAMDLLIPAAEALATLLQPTIGE